MAKKRTMNPPSGPLLARLVEQHSVAGLDVEPGLSRWAGAVDRFADGLLDADSLQLEMCRYFDRLALVSQATSRSIGRWKEPPLADAWTGIVAMFVDGVVRSLGDRSRGFRVSSEENCTLPCGATRKPDVGIWFEDRLVATVECKTTLGYRRDAWLQDYDERVQEFALPGGVFMFVATEHGWHGFPDGDPRKGTVWHALGPKGSWFGGGKTNEAPLVDSFDPGRLARFRDSLLKSLAAVGENPPGDGV